MLASGTTRVGGMKAVIKVLADLGFEAGPLIKRVGLDQATLCDPDMIVPSSVFGELFAQCVRTTKCDHFGLLVGAEGSLAWLGRVGFIVRNSLTVEEALRSLVKYFYHHDRSVVMGLREADGQTALSYALLFKMEAQDQWLANMMCYSLKIMRELCNPGWFPSEVTFAMPRPADIRPYQRLFRTRLTFDAAETAILFDASWLRRPVVNAEPELRRLLMKDIDESQPLDLGDFSLDVKRIVRTHIGTGHCTAKNLSGLLGVSVRALSGRLEESGTSFKQIVEDVRFEMAKQLIQNTDMPLRDISERLDYSEISAFTRAFSRWSGIAPGNWRRSMRAA